MNAPRNPNRTGAHWFDIGFTVFGEPIPQGSSKAYVVGKRAVVTHDNPRTRPWREAVKQAAIDAYGGVAPSDGPVSVSVWFTLAKPKSAPKRRKVWPTKRPDVDKLARAVLDALKDAGVYRDDSQVVYLCAYKHYVFDSEDAPGVVLMTPGAVVSVGTVEN